MIIEIENQIKKYPGLCYIVDNLKKYKNELTYLHKFGMVLIGPDCFKQHEAENIINFFKEKGFELVDIKLKFLNRTETENLFLPNSTCTKCDNLKWWMIQDSALTGNFAALVFYDKNANENYNCLKHLNSYKGKSNPLTNSNGKVRYDFSAINICLNLIHIPDNFGDFFKDTSPFFSVKEIINIINQDNYKLKQRNIDDKLMSIRLCEYINKYTFEFVNYKFKYLLLQKVIFKNEDIKQIIDHYKKVFELEKSTYSREERNRIFKENISKELTMIKNCKLSLINKIKKSDKLEKVDIYIDDYNILMLLECLTSNNKFKIEKKDIFKIIESEGIYVDQFEKLIINTSMIQ